MEKGILNNVKAKIEEEFIISKGINYVDECFNYELIFQKLEDFIIKNLPAKYTYHSIDHFRDVVVQAERIAMMEKVEKSLVNDIKLAAWLHDVGFVWGQENHEETSAEYAKILLKKLNFPDFKIDLISGMILSTKIPQSPKNLYEKILCDADLDYLGRDDYFIISSKLLKELELKNNLAPNEWINLQSNFIKSHKYFTITSRKLREKKKQKNLSEIQKH